MKNHPGVYYRDTPTGRRYEITFLDSLGVRRWQTVDGNLEDADAKLRSVKTRKDRGERVVSSKVTLAEVAAEWEVTIGELRPRTREKYLAAIRLHVTPPLGTRKVGSISEQDVAELVAELRQAGKAAWTVRGILVPLSRLFGFAVRRGYIPSNPVSRLDSSERPRVEPVEKRVLTVEEIDALIAAALPTYRPVLAAAAWSGMRQSELLGLRWRDIDFDEGFLRVSCQLSRSGEYVPPKTRRAVRDVVLTARLAQLLREHKLASPFSGDDDPVFASALGRPLGHRNVQSRGFDPAAERAGINPTRKKGERKRKPGETRRPASFHNLRDTFASHLIAAGEDVVQVSAQLGHADPSITLRVYAHEFAKARHAEQTRARLDAAFGNGLETGGGEPRATGLPAKAGKVAPLRATSRGGD